MGKILLKETSDKIEILHESTGNGQKQLYIEGIFAQSNVINKNRRKYSHEIMSGAIDKYIQEYVNDSRALGELNHPEYPFPNPRMGAILIKELKWDGDDVYGKALVLSTPEGEIVKGLLEGGFKMGVSTRGLGDVVEANGYNEVTDYLMTAIDCVDNPSGPDCYVNPINECVQWVQRNGIWQQQIKESLNNDDATELFKERFNSFLKSLIKQHKS